MKTYYRYEEEKSDNQQLTFENLISFSKRNEIKFSIKENTKLGLINKKKYTNLAFLLSDQSNLVIKFAMYDVKLNFLIKKSFTGSLIKILDNIKEQINRLIESSTNFKNEDFIKINNGLYSKTALREAILNSISHADYSSEINIKIEFFLNEVKITNPGGIYNATMNDIMNGIQTYRNPKLVNILDKLNIINNYGNGIFKIKMCYELSNKQPSFIFSTNYFQICLPSINEANDQINDFNSEILNLIEKFPGIKVPDIVNKLNQDKFITTPDIVRNALKRNLKQYIKYVGSNKTGGYYIKNKNGI